MARGECLHPALNCAPCASDAAGAGRPPQTSPWQRTLCIDLISYCSHTASILPPFPPSSGAGRQLRPAPGGRPCSGAGAGGGRHAHLLCPPVRPSHAAGAAQAAGKWANLKIGSGFWRRYAAAAAAAAPALLPLLLLHLHLHVCSANPCLWLLPLCAGAAAQSGGYPAGAAGAGGCVCHRRVLFLLCPLWSVCCRAAPIHKGVTEWRPACHAPPLPCLTACRSTKHVLVQAIIAVLPHPPCCSACRAERPSERLRGGRGCGVCAAHTRPSAHAAGCGVATGTQ